MNILSCFDGMSCGQLALKRIGIKIHNYYASEIDKYAIKVAKANFPDTIHLGDVKKINGKKLDVDLLIGGSPCQGFSFAGKQLNFNDVRSKLFFEYVRILNELKAKNPNLLFLLENVNMKQEFQDVITTHLGVSPIKINSSLLSAQNRVRIYWTNIPNVSQPTDKGILLADILENGVTDRDKSYCIDASYYKGGTLKQYFEKSRRQLVFKDAIALGVAQRGRNIVNGKRIDVKGAHTEQRIEINTTGKSNCLTSVQKDSMVLIVKEATKKGYIEVKNGECFDATFPNSKIRRGRLMKEKSNCLTATNYDFMQFKDGIVRKLTPIECERLQTVPSGYTNSVSNSQRYKMLGNGWTVDVIAHIFKNIKTQYEL